MLNASGLISLIQRHRVSFQTFEIKKIQQYFNFKTDFGFKDTHRLNVKDEPEHCVQTPREEAELNFYHIKETLGQKPKPKRRQLYNNKFNNKFIKYV